MTKLINLDMRIVIMTTALAINFEQFITVTNHQPVTTTLLITSAFKKRHSDVLRAVDDLDVPTDFKNNNFFERTQSIKIGRGATRQSRYVEMTKDGFILLVMGFNGQQANLIKIGYINAFNKMAEMLNKPQQLALPEPTKPKTVTIDTDLLEALLKCCNVAKKHGEQLEPAMRNLFDLLGVERYVKNNFAATAYDLSHEFNYWIDKAESTLAAQLRPRLNHF
ncbi:Rha family transcriptional regulator [Pasteurellaceae bacterium USgator11]|nr:Rha family transcriptional regulator [Pasteurellaceae bacterium UScroc12]TNG94750.1 Rha family transcriptional regulator [Pasteurellaceae bacterium USgator41]TNG97721.1 Rha family transcriptional regulator [Pasteurellaceae bacterium UScroc31]TNH01682.1 Rha family transcriptional regulator [Pasteurellaceae bacterium USgator11]